jgi:2-oxoglutarate dehydrogenase E2 component (dihydrolipoamide succinyltransferase)
MLIEVKVPVLPESVADGTLAKWHKQSGARVRRDESLVDLETDKVVLEIAAPQDGVLTEIKQADGAVVKSGEVVAVIDTSGAAAADQPDKVAAQSAAVKTPSPVPPVPAAANTELSPAVRKLVAENQVDPRQISGTGKDGRLTKGDVLRHLGQHPEPEREGCATVHLVDSDRREQRVAMTRLRSRIAERLVEAQHSAAMLTTFNEVNMQPAMQMRSRYQEAFQKKYGIKLGFMSFFIKAAVEALKQFPVVNASIDGSDIVYHNYFDIGVAVSTPRGLVVPILRDADVLSFAELEQTVTDFASRARDGKLTMEELSGGTFTITNGGVFGSLLSTPILNPPQSAILGMHKIAERPIVEGGAIVARPMMYLALSYDHRLIDGQEAVRFLVTIKDMLEDPARLLLQV